MATRGRLSFGCPFQLCTAPALASQPPCSLSPASPTISLSLSLPPSCSLSLLTSLLHVLEGVTHSYSYVSYKYTESMWLQPASPSLLPHSSPLILTPPHPPPFALVLGSAEKPEPTATVLPCAVGCVLMRKECEHKGL